MRLLHRLGVRPELVEVDEFAVILGLVLRPDLLHRGDPLAEELPAAVELRPVMEHLLRVPPPADAEQHASTREMVEARHFLGEDDRIALDHQADPGAELERRGHRGGRRERHERVERVPVLARQIAPARPRTPAAGRDVGVLRHEQALEPAALGLERQVVDAHRVVGGELKHAVFHGDRASSMRWRMMDGMAVWSGPGVTMNPHPSQPPLRRGATW